MSRHVQFKPSPLVAGAANQSEAISYVTGGLNADHIITALTYARSISPEEFRRKERKWATQHMPALVRATEVLFSPLEIKKIGIINAEAALAGAFLGGAVIRGMADQEVVDLDSCKKNMDSWGIMERGIVYNGVDIDQATQSRLLGPEAVDGLAKITHSASRTLCTTVIALSLIPAF